MVCTGARGSCLSMTWHEDLTSSKRKYCTQSSRDVDGLMRRPRCSSTRADVGLELSKNSYEAARIHSPA